MHILHAHRQPIFGVRPFFLGKRKRLLSDSMSSSLVFMLNLIMLQLNIKLMYLLLQLQHIKLQILIILHQLLIPLMLKTPPHLPNNPILNLNLPLHLNISLVQMIQTLTEF